MKLSTLLLFIALFLPFGALAQDNSGWNNCTALPDTARLVCFDAWASAQKPTPAVAVIPAPPPTPDQSAELRPCHNRQYSSLSRYWELEKNTDCGTFNIRGYRPVSLSVVTADAVNTTPSSPAPDHTATPVAYERPETRIQLSVRTKIAQSLLTSGEPTLRDSLWFGYTQQSYWQVFNAALSRPFRSTDHEPEIMYVYPSTLDLPGNWRLRYSGLGLVHQSNGQSLPLSRSWNRVYGMAGVENKDDTLRLQARYWQRIPEHRDDDNPDIVSKIGRGEITGTWDVSQRDTLSTTWRSTFANKSNGSTRAEWMHTLGDPATSGLRLHAQLFSGYGDSLIDYNRRRVVFGLGLSLIDF